MNIFVLVIAYMYLLYISQNKNEKFWKQILKRLYS